MITLKSAHEIELMRRAGKITAAARALAGEMVKPGVTTQEIDRAVEHFIRKQGAVPSFLHFPGPPGVRAFPGSVCASVNDEIIHGIPGPRVLREGDIVSIDVGAYIGGYHGDCAATFPCGKVSPEAQNLIDVTRQSFFEGIKFAKEGCRLYDISAAIQGYVESHGCSIVREYVGHGIGTEMHESPEIPNYGHPVVSQQGFRHHGQLWQRWARPNFLRPQAHKRLLPRRCARHLVAIGGKPSFLQFKNTDDAALSHHRRRQIQHTRPHHNGI